MYVPNDIGPAAYCMFSDSITINQSAITFMVSDIIFSKFVGAGVEVVE